MISREIGYWINEMKLDYALIAKVFAFSVASFAGAYYAQPLIHNNKDAADVLVNVFSILAGFLVAVMTIMGEPVYYRKRTWRYNQSSRRNYIKSLIRHKDLFHSYLITLALIFASRLVDGEQHPLFQLWLERGFLFFAFLAFAFSITLPDKLISKQLERFDDQVEEKRR